MDPSTLTGRVSLVTGAGRGIGRATAIALAEAGSAVVLGARTVSQLDEVQATIEERGGRAHAVQLDVRDRESIQRFVSVALDTYGQIDVLVANAGSNNGKENGAVGPLWEINPDAWWDDVAINFGGTFFCAQAVLAHMVARGRGHIVSLNSLGPSILPWPYDSAYACSKAAIARLTDSLAAEVRDHGISVFTLSPGRVHTQIVKDALENAAGRKWLLPMVKETAHVEVSPEVPAEAIVFLVSGEADGLTGRLLHATWDLRELARRAADIEASDLLQIRLAKDAESTASWIEPLLSTTSLPAGSSAPDAAGSHPAS
jgi:NAD(P)-dependent dehydrogenase (short-subunit alcohol dehydrogenase family)